MGENGSGALVPPRAVWRQEPRDCRALLALALVPGVGPGKIRRMVETVGSPASVLGAGAARLARVHGIGQKTAAAIEQFDAAKLVDEQIERARRSGARLVTLWDADYPPLLREIYDPPVFLWRRGEAPIDSVPAIAVVGTRRPSDAGRRIAESFAGDLARRGVLVVSGLASGIDAAAHVGAMDAGGLTVAVLGSGVDRLYPPANTRLAGRMLKTGALLSEYPMGTAPDAVNFPRRNRIISGMCAGTLVVEAHREGGALITAQLALEQNREVFAVPGSIANPAASGCHELIQQGTAKLVTCVDDMLAELRPAVEQTEVRTAVEHAELSQLPEIEQLLLSHLSCEPVHIDALCDRVSLDVSVVLVHLLTLEFKGFVRQLAGKQFYRDIRGF